MASWRRERVSAFAIHNHEPALDAEVVNNQAGLWQERATLPLCGWSKSSTSWDG